ncbi:MAG: hypothetical protein MUD01_23300 [Chloroflexaceae bacterium]|jgi:hypothetical protein|nr:hypothetical protein [Chloroflexaceae bacterium]
MTEQQKRDMLRMRQLLEDPHSDPAEIADCYVRLLGPQLQELARRGYAQSGRGAVEIDLCGIDLRHATGNMPIAYYPVSDIEFAEWPEGTRDVLVDYDPQREVVVLLIQDAGALIYVLE